MQKGTLDLTIFKHRRKNWESLHMEEGYGKTRQHLLLIVMLSDTIIEAGYRSYICELGLSNP